MRVHYLSFYVDGREAPNRKTVVSVQGKVRYIIDCLKSLDLAVSVVSSAVPIDNDTGAAATRFYIDKNEEHIYLPFSVSSIKGGTVRNMRDAIKEYVNTSVADGDVLMVYHSPAYMPLYSRWGKWSQKFKFILEINDRYCLHYGNGIRSHIMDWLERVQLKKADGYVLASPWIRELIPACAFYAVNYGDATVCQQQGVIKGSTPFKVVYAGVVESSRRAAYIVAEAASYLSYEYEIHIAGFGNEHAVDELLSLIDTVNKNTQGAKVFFHGCLEGWQLDQLLLSSNVAVNSHSYPEGMEWQAKYSYPSKIPLYCGHGLYVISCCEEAFSISEFSPCLRYFKSGDSASLAKAIVDFREESPDGVDPREITKDIDRSFKIKMKCLAACERKGKANGQA